MSLPVRHLRSLWTASCTVLLWLVAGTLCGCGGGSSAPVTVGGITISVLPNPAFAAPGGPQQFTANVANTSNKAVTWEVNGVAGGSTATGTISSSGLYTAPTAAGTVTITAVLQSDSTKSGSANVTVLAPHTVAVRQTSSGFAEFYEVSTGSTFTPRGNNYIRLAWQQPPFQGWPEEYYHSTFNAGLYDSARAETALATMQTSGYNIVRVFLNGCCTGTIGNPNGRGLSSAYIANVVDFLSRAANHGIYVIVTWEWLPAQGGYWSSPLPSCPDFLDPNNPTSPSVNMIDLCSGGVATTAQFFHDLAQALVSQGAHLDAIFSYELRNEFYFDSSLPPLNWTSGMVTAADGQTYDMSSPASQQQMMNNGLIYFTNQVRAAIIAVDPTALVDVGFFWPQTPNPTRIGDPRVIELYPMMANSTVDFVKISSPDSSSELALPQLVQNYGFVGYQQQKPVLMGEFDANESDFPLITDAVTRLQNWQIDSCPYSVKGWLLWTWDTDETEQQSNPPDWYATAGDGSINTALAPAVRPNPCQ
jgi:hypothetical protein